MDMKFQMQYKMHWLLVLTDHKSCGKFSSPRANDVSPVIYYSEENDLPIRRAMKPFNDDTNTLCV